MVRSPAGCRRQRAIEDASEQDFVISGRRHAVRDQLPERVVAVAVARIDQRDHEVLVDVVETGAGGILAINLKWSQHRRGSLPSAILAELRRQRDAIWLVELKPDPVPLHCIVGELPQCMGSAVARNLDRCHEEEPPRGRRLRQAGKHVLEIIRGGCDLPKIRSCTGPKQPNQSLVAS